MSWPTHKTDAVLYGVSGLVIVLAALIWAVFG